jgi:hypothetical protein
MNLQPLPPTTYLTRVGLVVLLKQWAADYGYATTISDSKLKYVYNGHNEARQY